MSKPLEKITDRVNAEQALIEIEQRFRAVADFTDDWEYWIASDSYLLYVSPSCERITGTCSTSTATQSPALEGRDVAMRPGITLSWIRRSAPALTCMVAVIARTATISPGLRF